MAKFRLVGGSAGRKFESNETSEFSKMPQINMFKPKGLFPTVLKEKANVSIVLADGTKYLKEGTILFADNTVNVQTDSIGIYAQFDNAEGVLNVGSAVTVNVASKESEMYVGVPSTAIIYKNAGTQLYVVKDGVAELRDVVLGPSIDGVHFIKEGVTENDIVVHKGTHKVYPGAKVIGIEE